MTSSVHSREGEANVFKLCDVSSDLRVDRPRLPHRVAAPATLARNLPHPLLRTVVWDASAGASSSTARAGAQTEGAAMAGFAHASASPLKISIRNSGRSASCA